MSNHPLISEYRLPDVEFAKRKLVRLAYVVTHPIQYQAPLLARLAAEPDIELQVFFSSDLSVRGYTDPGFGVRVMWDTPLLEGYNYEFLPRVRDKGNRLGFARPINFQIYRRLREGNFDAVWVHGYHTINLLRAIVSARALRLPVFLRTDSNLYDRPRSKAKLKVKRFLATLMRRCVTGVLAIGQANAEYWHHYWGEDVPIFPMPYAVDNEFFRRQAKEASRHREELRRELGLEPGRPIILFASKLQLRKRCRDLVEAYLRLAPAPGVDPKAYLLIVGDGEERASLEELAKASGLSSIRFLGFRNQSALPGFYDLCDVFVLPSIHEPWGLVINEVMNAGRAVIVTDEVGCQPDLVKDGFNGFVIPSRNIDALTAVLRRVLADPAALKQMGQNGRDLIDRYSFEADIKGLRQALEACVPGFRA